MYSLAGSVFGVLFISVVQELLLRVQDSGVHVGPIDFDGRAGLQQVCLALIMLGVLVKRPDGLSGKREWTAPAWLQRHNRNSEGLT
jgi:branched-chain amino acid transport system permease protein